MHVDEKLVRKYICQYASPNGAGLSAGGIKGILLVILAWAPRVIFVPSGRGAEIPTLMPIFLNERSLLLVL